MTLSNDLDVVWHNDGHKIELRLDHHQVVATAVPCPNVGDSNPACVAPDAACVVEYFVGLYGLECNQGVAPAEPFMGIAWSLVGDRRDLGACQLWFMPVTDEAFGVWLGGFEDA